MTKIRIGLPGRDGGADEELGVLRYGEDGMLRLDRPDCKGSAVLERLCEKYNGVERLHREVPSPTGNPLESWARIIGRGDPGFLDAVIETIAEDFGLQVERV
jgi:hypothetical protein